METTKQPRWKRDLRFIYWAFIIGTAISLYFRFTGDPLPDPKDDTPSQRTHIAQFSDTLLPLDQPAVIRTALAQYAGKPFVFSAYASWCVWCRKNMPLVVNELQQRPHLAHFFVSYDKTREEAARYLVIKQYDGLWEPYWLHPAVYENLQSQLNARGSGFRTSLPYLAYFGADGKLMHELSGYADYDTMTAFWRQIP